MPLSVGTRTCRYEGSLCSVQLNPLIWTNMFLSSSCVKHIMCSLVSQCASADMPSVKKACLCAIVLFFSVLPLSREMTSKEAEFHSILLETVNEQFATKSTTENRMFLLLVIVLPQGGKSYSVQETLPFS